MSKKIRNDGIERTIQLFLKVKLFQEWLEEQGQITKLSV